jgi:hypothetical protein
MIFLIGMLILFTLFFTVEGIEKWLDHREIKKGNLYAVRPWSIVVDKVELKRPFPDYWHWAVFQEFGSSGPLCMAQGWAWTERKAREEADYARNKVLWRQKAQRNREQEMDDPRRVPYEGRS